MLAARMESSTRIDAMFTGEWHPARIVDDAIEDGIGWDRRSAQSERLRKIHEGLEGQ
jgi:hypothetical protein